MLLTFLLVSSWVPP